MIYQIKMIRISIECGHVMFMSIYVSSFLSSDTLYLNVSLFKQIITERLLLNGSMANCSNDEKLIDIRQLVRYYNEQPTGSGKMPFKM